MPLYELLCLARPALQRQVVARMIAAAGELVQARGGVVMDVSSYGEQPLAYRVRGVQGKFDKVRAARSGGCLAMATARTLRWTAAVIVNFSDFAYFCYEIGATAHVAGPATLLLLLPPRRHISGS